MGDAVGAVGVNRFEGVAFGIWKLLEMELGDGGVETAVEIVLRNEGERTIGHIESEMPVFELRGDVGEAEIRGRVSDIGGGGLRTSVARFGNFISGFENLA